MRVSIDDPVAADYFRLFLEKLAWHGICQADFIVDERTHVPYLIDINPRFWGSLVQGIASGVDFPYMLYRIARDGDTEAVTDYRKGVVTRWICGDLRTLPEALRCTSNKISFLKNYIRMFGNGVVFDDFSLCDPLPFFTFGIDFLAKMIQQKTLHPSSHDFLEGIWE
jgi:predicted ATP-grasp superfamily ATP-dependent carboligase